jgi:hypothetical protein
MKINEDKSSFFSWGMLRNPNNKPHRSLVSPPKQDSGFKYLGFHLKANGYVKRDWLWLVTKIEKKINSWCNRWLSKESRLVLLKSVLEAIPIYWITLTWVPKGILNKIISSLSIPLVKLQLSILFSTCSLERIFPPKGGGGLGTKKHSSILSGLSCQKCVESGTRKWPLAQSPPGKILPKRILMTG